jgi:hypothetical protein
MTGENNTEKRDTGDGRVLYMTRILQYIEQTLKVFILLDKTKRSRLQQLRRHDRMIWATVLYKTRKMTQITGGRYENMER